MAPLTLLASITCLAFWIAAPLSAEIVIDDFDKDAVDLPDDGLVEFFAITEGVGQLRGRRLLRIAAIGPAIGSVDVNITQPSNLTASVEGFDFPLDFDPIVNVQSVYEFETPVDLTEGGRNDAFLFEFGFLRSSVEPEFLRVTVRNFSLTAVSTSYSLAPAPRSDNPFRVVMPFDEFTDRSGRPIELDFSTVSDIHMDLRATPRYGSFRQLGFETQLERFLVGRAIPEPSCCGLLVLVAIAPVVSTYRANARRRQSRVTYSWNRLEPSVELPGDQK